MVAALSPKSTTAAEDPCSNANNTDNKGLIGTLVDMLPEDVAEQTTDAELLNISLQRPVCGVSTGEHFAT